MRYTILDLAVTRTSATIEVSPDETEACMLETVHVPDEAEMLFAAGVACCAVE